MEDIHALVRAAQAGDQTAMAAICERFAPLLRSVRQRFGQKGEAEDTYQEACLALLEAVKTYRTGGRIPFAGYAKSRVVYHVWNRCKRHWASTRRQAPLWEEAGTGPGRLTAPDLLPGELLERREAQEQVREALSSLSARQRQVLYLVYYRGSTLGEAARQLGISVQAVQQLKARGIKKLAKILPGR